MKGFSSRLAGRIILALILSVFYGCQKGEESGETLKKIQPKESIRISGSASALPLVKLLAQEFEKNHPGTQIQFFPESHTKGALAAVREGDWDIGILSRALTEEEGEYGLQYLHLAQDGIVFATHKSVNITSITPQQLRDIYSGRITNWIQLGGNRSEINVLDRPEHTSPKIVLREKLFGSTMKILDNAVVLERPSQMNESLKMIPNSIGYTSLGEFLSSSLDVNILDINGIPANPIHIKENLYQLSRPFGMVIPATPKRMVMQFIDFIDSDSAIKIIESNGYLPIMSQFVIATIPERNIIRLEERYLPLVEYLSIRLGPPKVKIILKHLPSYQEIVDAFIEGRVNAAFFGSFVYALTQAKVGVEVIARPEKNGVSQYKGLIFTRKDSGIKDWKGLKGQSFAMIRATTAGELFPKIFFKAHDVKNMEEYLGSISYVGSHDVSILKVLNGEIAAGSAKDLIYKKIAKEDPRIENEMVILAESPPVPENALVVRKNIEFVCFNCHQRIENKWSDGSSYTKGYSMSLTKKLREILLQLPETEEGREVLRKFGADRFVETDHSDYNELYQMIKTLGIDLKTYHFSRRDN